MAELVLSLGGSILSTLSKAMELWEQKHMNEEIQGELEQFVRDLRYNIRLLQEKSMQQGSRCSNTTSWALDALQKDLEIADSDVKNILNKGFLMSTWDANKIRSKLETLRERVMTSFQTRLILALLDVAVESQQGQENFQTAMLNMNKELGELYSSKKADQSLEKSMQVVIRKELQVMLKPLMVAIQSNGRKDIETTMSTIRNTRAHTSEMEKFFEDVIAGLEDVLKQSSLSKKDEDPSALMTQDMERHYRNGPKWYQDPITWELMCDPVKASDGHTYDRWTILRHSSSMVRSPFRQDENHPFVIEKDDISIRSHLFQKFPDQVVKFKAERAAYRNAALQAVNNGNFGESLVMLNNVLGWDPQDVECSSKRDHVQRQLDVGKIQGTTLRLKAATVQEQGVGDNINSTSTSSSSSVQVPAVVEVDGTNGKSTQNQNSAGKKEGGNDRGYHNFGEKDGSVLEMRPERFDRASVDNGAVGLSTDGLMAEYKLAKGAGATVVANAPCPSDCYPFYFEVLVHPSIDDCNQDVAIGFSINISGEQKGGLGTYSGSCGYYAMKGKVYYYLGVSGYYAMKGKTHVLGPINMTSADVCYPAGGYAGRAATAKRIKGGYVLGAGFHRSTGIVFFMVDGHVVALLEATRFSCNQMLFPAVSLHSRGAKVKANFGPTWVLREPQIAAFENKFGWSASDSLTQAIMTTQSVPMRTNVFYFEYLFDSSFFGPKGERAVSFGFAGTSTFLKTEEPGSYANSCGVFFAKLPVIGGNNRHIKQNTEVVTTWAQRSDMDQSYRVGVGIHYGTNEIFFTMDGCFLHSVRNRLQCPVNAVAACTGTPFTVKDFYWQTCVGHLNWVSLPTKLQPSLCSSPKFMSTLDHQGLKARHTGFVVDPHNKQNTSHYFGVAAFSADMVAPLQSHAHDTSKKPFYFELIVTDKGDNGYIAIGFSHFQHFKHSEQLGCYDYSCAYHGNSGKLFAGTRIGEDFGPTFSTGDRVGAGFNHHTNTIFFVKNGEVVGSTQNMMGSCALYPAVGLGSYGEEVHLNFLGFHHAFGDIQGDSPNTSTPCNLNNRLHFSIRYLCWATHGR